MQNCQAIFVKFESECLQNLSQFDLTNVEIEEGQIKLIKSSKKAKPRFLVLCKGKDDNTNFTECLNKVCKIKKLTSAFFDEKDWKKEIPIIKKVCHQSLVDPTIEKLEDSPTLIEPIVNVPVGYEKFFSKQQKLLQNIHSTVCKDQFYPPKEDWFRTLELTSLKNVRVIILGQDPYHGAGQAHGISFSVRDGVKPPPSLTNIFKELEEDGFKISNKNNGNLEKWCKQGVLMLNTAFSVKRGEANSHGDIWREVFTPELLKFINTSINSSVIILWGGHAQSFGSYFDERHKKITSAHPSPLSYTKGFQGSKPFSKTNKLLKQLKREPINWNL